MIYRFHEEWWRPEEAIVTTAKIQQLYIDLTIKVDA